MNPDSNEAPGLGLPSPAMSQDSTGVVIPAQTQPSVSPAPSAPSMVPQTQPQEDNANDLEEEWVNKAKAIIEQTKADPFLESNELSRMKADYLKSRYNKDVKTGKEHN